MEEILIGSTDRTILVWIPDPASTTGAGKTGLAAAAVTVTHTRVETDNDVVHTDVTSSVNDLSALTDAHNDWGWKEVSSTLSKGLYRLDVADAVFATGAWYAVIQVTITSGTAAATPKQFILRTADVETIKADTAAILIDTNELQTDWVNGGRLDLIIDAILVDTGTTLDGKIDVIDGIVDSILVDTNELQVDWVNGGRLDLLLDATLADTNELQTDWVNGGRLDLLLDAALADTNELQTDWVNGGRLDLILDIIAADTTTDIPGVIATVDTVVDAIKVITDALGATAAARLALSAGQIIPFTVDTGAPHTPTTTEFQADDITEATADHYNGRIIIWTTGALAGQATSISDYAKVGANGQFTVVAMTEAPANNDTGIIV